MYPLTRNSPRCAEYLYCVTDSSRPASPSDRFPSPTQQPQPHDAPIVQYTPDTSTQPIYADGGTRREPDRPLDRPPETDHATEYARTSEEIEPLVTDLR